MPAIFFCYINSSPKGDSLVDWIKSKCAKSRIDNKSGENKPKWFYKVSSTEFTRVMVVREFLIERGCEVSTINQHEYKPNQDASSSL